MTDEMSSPRPHEILGLLGSADRETIERRSEALGALLKLGLAPPEGDAVALPQGFVRTPEAVAEAARLLRDPQRWLRETLLWIDGRAAEEALPSVAELLEGASGQPTEPAALLRQLAHQYLTDEVSRHGETDQPERWIGKRLTPPANPPLYLGADEKVDSPEGA
jgi:hypothetical protein